MAAYAPSGLTPDDFEDLAESIDASWQDWVRETGQFVQDFYEGEHASVEDQRAAIGRLRVKLNTLEKALGDRRYRSIHNHLADLHGKLARPVDLAEAVLDTLTVDVESARQERLAPGFDRLRASLRDLRRTLREYQGGEQWLTWVNAETLGALSADDENWIEAVNEVKSKLEKRDTFSDEIRDFLSQDAFLDLEDALANLQRISRQTDEVDQAQLRERLGNLLETTDGYQSDPNAALEARIRQLFSEIRQTAPDGGAAISSALQAHYLNYNLRLAVSEGLLNKFVSETRRQSSPVRDRLMGAYITGNQHTTTDVRLSLQPSRDQARMLLVLNGTVRSNTMGYAEQATVHSVGHHTFRAEKPIFFNGDEFITQPSTVAVNANNSIVNATTRMSRAPIIGRIADNIAMREANARRPQANALAAGRIRSQVRSELDPRVDDQFAQASMKLQSDRYGPLREQGLYPDVMAVSSTSSELRVWTRLMETRELGGSRPVPGTRVPANGLVAQVHETLMTNGITRFDLDGKTMLESEVRKHLEERFSKLLRREVTFPEPEMPEGEEPMDNTLVFAEKDAVRFQARGGVLTIMIRAGLLREGQDDIPEQIITVPFALRIDGDQIVLDRGNVGVRPVSRPPSVAEQVARANVMRQRIQSALPSQTIDAEIEIDLEDRDRKVALKVTDISARNGWLTIAAE